MINTDKNLFLHRAQNTIAITSGVGSMGKTWLSITLAHALNILHSSVLLFDADNGLLNVEYQLGLHNSVPLDKAVFGNATLNQTVVAVNRRKFDAISGIVGGNVLASAPIGRLHLLSDDLLILAENYDFTLLDLPTQESVAAHFLPKAEYLILVCTDSPSNIVSSYKFLQNLAQNGRNEKLQVVVNYAQSYEEGLQTFNILRRACERYINQTPELLGVVRRDTRVRDAIHNKVPLLSRYPNSEAAEDVMQIARRVLKFKEKINA